MLDVRDVRVIADERAARAQLRGQIAALEAQLSDAVVSAFPHGGVHSAVPAPGGPRLLTLGELERIRDALAERLAAGPRGARGARRAPGGQPRRCSSGCCSSPAATSSCASPTAISAQSGCGVWQVRPRLGLIGMLMGWWQVKLSSGCPLAS